MTTEELEPITSIQFAESEQCDFLSWLHTKNRDFSVRSAYHLELQRRNGKISSSNLGPSKELWKRIWEANILQKVKNMLWKATRNGLLVMEVLKNGVWMLIVFARAGKS